MLILSVKDKSLVQLKNAKVQDTIDYPREYQLFEPIFSFANVVKGITPEFLIAVEGDKNKFTCFQENGANPRMYYHSRLTKFNDLSHFWDMHWWSTPTFPVGFSHKPVVQRLF